MQRHHAGADAGLTEDVARLIVQARRQVWMAAARHLAEDGESVLAWQLVAQLMRGGPRSQRDLAEAVGQHPAGVSRQLEDLDALGLTARAQDAADRRCRFVTLTPKGRRWYARWRPRVYHGVEDALERLSEEERRALCVLLSKMITAPEGRA